ncbi:MAG TPA: hypothetical protein PK657_14565 [Legionella sp.]|nr:hypothetical protein [Legionella sp.]
MPDTNSSDFVPVEKSQINTDVSYQHDVCRGTLIDTGDTTWVRKKIAEEANARIELLAQEFFRLIIPHQPITRIAKDSSVKPDIYYILSEEIKNYQNLPLNQPGNFANNTFTGLGQALVVSMFLEEIDLKNGNIGINKNGQVVKIDGEWCFAEFFNKETYELTPENIANLPYPINYSSGFYAYNWLDLINQNVFNPTSFIVNPSLSTAPQFRNEVNQALLKICIIPDRFIDRFVDTYTCIQNTRYKEFFKRRRTQLQISALQNPSFWAYLTTEGAIQAAEQMIDHMKNFATTGTPIIPSDEIEVLVQHTELKFYQLIMPILEQMKLQELIDTYSTRDHKLTQPESVYRSIIGKVVLLISQDFIECNKLLVSLQKNQPEELFNTYQNMTLCNKYNSVELKWVYAKLKSVENNTTPIKISTNPYLFYVGQKNNGNKPNQGIRNQDTKIRQPHRNLY